MLISSGCLLCSRQLISGQQLQPQPLPPVTFRQINSCSLERCRAGARGGLAGGGAGTCRRGARPDSCWVASHPYVMLALLGRASPPFLKKTEAWRGEGSYRGAPGSSSAGSQTARCSPEGPTEALSLVLNTGPAQSGPCPTGHLGSSERSEGPSWTLSHCFNKSNF